MKLKMFNKGKFNVIYKRRICLYILYVLVKIKFKMISFDIKVDFILLLLCIK